MTIINLFLILLAVVSGAMGALALKIGSMKLPSLEKGVFYFIESVLTNHLVVIGVTLYLIPTIIVIWLLRVIPLTVLQPVLSLTYVVTALLAVYFLNEPISTQRILGIVLIVIGVVLVGK